MNGASGATVDVLNDIVVKRDAKNPDRLQQQAAFMRMIGPTIFPEVLGSFDGYYVMERLHPLQHTKERAEGGILNEMVSRLTLMWDQPVWIAVKNALGDDHRDYMRPRWGPYHRRMNVWLHKMKDARVTLCSYIHGDPTVENVMQRGAAGIVFIDPLPASRPIPSLLAVDLGKMLQSVFGYEAMRDPTTTPLLSIDNRISFAEGFLANFGKDDGDLALYFLCVHYARLIPYQLPETRHLYWDTLTNLIEVFSP